MQYLDALKTANEVKDLLAPFCERIEIAGSIRRQKSEVKDIEIVAIPKPYETGLFCSGLATVVEEWEAIKGQLEYKGRPGVKACKYTQRRLPNGMILDLFFANATNWGYIFALRTGPSEFNISRLIPAAKKQGYHFMNGYLHYGKKAIPTPEEADLFKILQLPFIAPVARSL